jgi:hypothetical protein
MLGHILRPFLPASLSHIRAFPKSRRERIARPFVLHPTLDEAAMPEPEDEKPPHYSADQVRGAEIDLRTRTQRVVFIGGLVAAVALTIILKWAAII